MATFTKASIIATTIDIEGGYVNNPDDSGGETNFGITIGTANLYKKDLVALFKWNGKMINLTKEMATWIYENKYWKPVRLDDIFKISPALADRMFDIAVNVGISFAGLWLQNALNAFNRQGTDYADIVADGIVGSGTLNALNALIKKRGLKPTIKNVGIAIMCQQGSNYLSSSQKYQKNETFTWGWFSERVPRHLDEFL